MSYSEKGRLPACTIDAALFDRIWSILGEDGDFLWQAVVGTGGDLLGQQKDRPQEIITDRGRLGEILQALPRIDSLQFTGEVDGKGAVSLTFRLPLVGDRRHRCPYPLAGVENLQPPDSRQSAKASLHPLAFIKTSPPAYILMMLRGGDFL